LDLSKPLGICETCRISSAPEQISCRTPPRATKPFERVYFDLIQIEEGYNGDKWVLHFLDDFSKLNFVYILQSKWQITDIVQDFSTLIQNQYGQSVKIYRTDGERSLEHKFRNWTGIDGIITEISAPYTLAQNGAAE